MSIKQGIMGIHNQMRGKARKAGIALKDQELSIIRSCVFIAKIRSVDGQIMF